ncbi:MAG: fibronectin type III domain-containing protein [Syntrophobacteraceae bacterium]
MTGEIIAPCTVMASFSTTPSGPSATVPYAPTDVTATAGNGQATVSFKLPANGGSTITGYTVTSSPGGITASGAGSPIRVNGLTNGTAYTFTVTATNAIGTSQASTPSNSVTPEAPRHRR